MVLEQDLEAQSAFWMNAVLIDYYILFQDCFFGYTGALVDIFGNTIDFMRRYTLPTLT